MTTSTVIAPFHLAIPVDNLEAARRFYGDLLGCSEGRSSSHWVDFNFFGHQLVTHLAGPESKPESKSDCTNLVDGDSVPVPHFGIVLPMHEWQTLADKLTVAGTKFIIEPHIRFKGETGEQATMFLLDLSGNALEFKAFQNIDQLFAR